MVEKYKTTPQAKFIATETARSLRAKYKPKTLNIKMRAPIDQIKKTAKMTGTANRGASVRFCLMGTGSGLFIDCRVATLAFAQDDAAKSFRFTGVAPGNWVVIALPPTSRGRVEPITFRK